MPAASAVAVDPGHAKFFRDGSRPPEPHPAKFRHMHRTPAAVQPAGLGVADNKPLRTALRAKRRLACRILLVKERVHGVVKVTQSLLLNRRRSSSEPGF